MAELENKLKNLHHIKEEVETEIAKEKKKYSEEQSSINKQQSKIKDLKAKNSNLNKKIEEEKK